ncbi:translational GTPase TypA [Bradymonadaceae bacterium TMQ3]|uniref:Large ribosomal subunit assembly factor BipA n=1 Tax=Lujinxingia sediminis TaxID=2480984 RepID=A0ABY0CST1_9DELT|nr:translational GTPase TypA [Lujinxingia sediminis]RDV38925.1 translational GTPase TypA [Bradymonadaceae bacterium TMQ3]RVU44160.1 translational GTPase TypA [Lujinxingia sediminis]TXC76302.1 translational GTPase TypA [Bradymonadales bacterium TMQ1]
MTNIRNIAIVAHVDHGKTTLIDELLKQSNTIAGHRELAVRAMDSNDLEKERGITIVAKCTAIDWEGYRINIIDTPGHADFGGEVERVLKLVDSVLLLVDAFEGPMPQTKFVLRKSLELGLKPVVVINKIDRPNGRPDAVLNMVFDLFGDLEANDEQLDFPVVYASGLGGFAKKELEDESTDMRPLLEAIVEYVDPPKDDPEGPLQMQVATLKYDEYLGRVAIGRVFSGKMRIGDRVVRCQINGEQVGARITKLFGFKGLDRVDREEVSAGDIVAVAGLEGILPGETICSPDAVNPLPMIAIDEPTVSMVLMINNSPFAGTEGKYLTSRQIRERLDRELEQNVALKVEPTENNDAFIVSGRGELHLSILIEQMRREGFEMQVSQPRVIYREDENGKKLEPIEEVIVETEQDYAGTVIQKLSERKGELVRLDVNSDNTQRLEFRVPSRGLFGYRSEFLTDTRGTGIMYTNFAGYEPFRGELLSSRNGVLIALERGDTTAYALFNLQDRGTLFVGAGEAVYDGQIIGLHSRDNDLVVNPNKKKQLSNMRSSGSDDALILSPPVSMTLEKAIEFIEADEYVEITPTSIRLRKAELNHSLRKRK